MKILNILNNIVLTLIIIILSMYILLRFTNQITVYKIAADSMETGIRMGDYVIVKKEKEYKEGDIVTYLTNGKYITHKIEKIENDRIIAKEEIAKDNIIGKYIYKSKFLNFIIEYKYIIAGILATIIVVLITIPKVIQKND